MPFLSVIIPVYEVEDYLNQCVDSILNQTFSDIEVILVNDGSTDRCPNICDEYKKRDSRVKVIHKKNEGASVARNIGLENATGEYVVFVDSDDYWKDNEGLEILVKQLDSKPDFILFRSLKYYQQENRLVEPIIKYDKEILKSNNKLNIFKYLSKNGIFPGGVWDKIIKRDILIQNNIKFNSNLISSEDIDFVLNLIVYSNHIKCSNTDMYVYRQQRKESVTNNIKFKNVSDLFSTITKWEKNIYQIKDKELNDLILNLLSYEYSILLALLPTVKSDTLNEFEENIKRYTWLLEYDLNPKVKKVKKIYKFLGFKGTNLFLSLMLKLR